MTTEKRYTCTCRTPEKISCPICQMAVHESAVDLEENRLKSNGEVAIERLQGEGWAASSAEYGDLFCGSCGNARGLFVRDREGVPDVRCGGCLVYGHPSFAQEDELYRE